MFGWEHVRGGNCCRVLEPRAPATLQAFRRDPTRAFEYLTRAELDELVGRVLALMNPLAVKEDAAGQQ